MKLETRAILKQCIEARAALAELKQAAELTVGQLEFDGSIPFIVLKTTDEKSREGNSLPLRADLPTTYGTECNASKRTPGGIKRGWRESLVVSSK